MQGQHSSTEAYQQLLEARRVSIESTGNSYPLLVCSYSSRGFANLASLYTQSHHIPRASLVSLYDVNYGYLTVQRAASIPKPTGLFFDSGGYEIKAGVDPLDLEAEPKHRPWSVEHYITSAKNVVTEHDILASFDGGELQEEVSMQDQVTQAVLGFQKVGNVGFKRDVLIHLPDTAQPDSVAREIAEIVAAFSSDLDCIGFTEKDLGNYKEACSFLISLRQHLQTLTKHYIPIHVFGCLDPRTIPYLFFSGADIFDGLSWLRYYFRGDRTYYSKEIEFQYEGRTIPAPEDLLIERCKNNAEELERLRNDLSYSLNTGDPYRFEDSLDLVIALKQVAFSSSSTAPQSP